ncbi:MAG: threonine--tRNA ligase [Candidatus Dojkabacteria bacterium]|nr:MAG: threonine--tRNA ligase [Candidatus Dojkabacteria bacterium]
MSKKEKKSKNPDVPELEKMRHTAAHVLAQAVLKLYPETKLGIGPAIENGFYYDFDFAEPISEEDLPKIEAEMKQIIKSDLKMNQEFVERDGAIERYKALEQKYKLDLMENVEGDPLSFYVTGDGEFVDLCRGPHVDSTKKVGHVKLLSLAGAYWRGDEKQPMLTRIYGTAFATKEELKAHLDNLELAKERDHRKLGKELGLFTFSETVGKGLPLWTPKGSIIRRELERFIVDLETERGYLHVYTPDIANLKLYEKSGHYPYYKESMYSPIEIDDEKYMLRPMTCPHHFELFLSEPRSYRDLPMRIAELAKLYRYEQSGELSGLMRVRSFCLSDAHIVCADDEQAKDEIRLVLQLIEDVAGTFGLKMGDNFWYRLSLGDREDEKKYYKDDKAWDKAEKILRDVLVEREAIFEEAEDEAAFYGPKIDIQMKNVAGKSDTAFTVQYDFVMPKRFKLNYIDANNEEREAVVVHRSGIGAVERTVAFLIEHFGGAFPLWISPEQVRILPITDKHLEYAEALNEQLKSEGIRSMVDNRNERLQYKIRDAEVNKIPYTLVVGDKEVETDTIAVRVRGLKDQGLHKKDEFINMVTEEIDNRSIGLMVGSKK